MKRIFVLSLLLTTIYAKHYTAGFYARAASDIYTLSPAIIQKYQNMGFAAGSTTVKGVPILLLKNATSQHIILRGTYSLKNWLTNSHVYAVPYHHHKDLLVHEGYYETALSITNMIVKYLDTYKTVGIAGHSLGGAVALFVALELQQRGFTVNLYTFGMPAVGNKAFVNYAKKIKHKRYVHVFDIIPNVNGSNLEMIKKFARRFSKNLDPKQTFLRVLFKTIENTPKYFVQDDNQITLYQINPPKQDILPEPWMMPAYYHLAINYANILDPKKETLETTH